MCDSIALELKNGRIFLVYFIDSGNIFIPPPLLKGVHQDSLNIFDIFFICKNVNLYLGKKGKNHSCKTVSRFKLKVKNLFLMPRQD